MATLFSLNNGNFSDYNTLGFSLTSAEITNNTTGVNIPSNKAYCVPFVDNSSSYTLSAISVHLSAVSPSPTGTFGIVINKFNKSTYARTTVVENYPISSFTSYDGTNNFSNTYPSNWHTLNLSNPITVLSSESVLLCLSTSDANQLSLMGSLTAVNRSGFNLPTIVGTLSTSSDSLPYSYFSDSLYFDGSTKWFTFPANTRYALSGDFTIEFWVNTSTYTTDTNTRRVFGGSAVASVNNLEILFLPTSNAIKVQTNASTLIDGNIAVADGNWHHVAVTRNGTSMKLFVDGAQSGATYTTSTNFSTGSASGFTIGKYGGASNGRFLGYLSNVHVVNGTSLYNSAFTNTPTILEPVPTSNTVLLLKSGVQIDKALITTNSTLTGFISESGTITRSASGTRFTKNVSQLNEVLGTKPYTLIPKQGDYTFEILFYQTDNTFNQVAQLFNISTILGVNVANSPQSIGISNLNITQSVNLSTWYHAAYTKCNDKCYLFVNGQLKNTGTAPNPNYSGSETSTFIFNDTYYGINFDGIISYVSIVKYAKYISDFTPNLDPTQVVLPSLYQSFLYTQSTSGYYTATYAPSSTLVKDNYHINHNINLDASPAVNNLYIHKNGTLNFNNQKSASLLVAGPDGIQVTQEGTLNIGTSSSVVPLSTTHSIILSSNYIDVHNGGNVSIYGSPKQLYTSLTNDINAGNNIFAITDVVSSTWKANDTILFIPNTTQKLLSFDSLTLGGFTNSNTLTTNSPSLYNHLGIGLNPYVPSIYNLTKNVILSTIGNTTFNMKFLGAAKNSINDAQINNLGNFGIRSVLDNNGYLNIKKNVFNKLRTEDVLTSDDTLSYSIKFEDNKHLVIANNVNLNLNDSDSTLEFNIYHIANSTGYIYVKQDGTFDPVLLLRIIGGNLISFRARYLNSPNFELTSTRKLKLNSWNNVVLTHQISTKTVRIYINGKLSGSLTYSGWTVSSGIFTFGSYSRSLYPLDGSRRYYNTSQSYLNNFRITKSLLYTSDFSPTFDRLLVLPNTKLLLFQNEIIKDESKTVTVTNTFISYNVNPNKNLTNVSFNENLILNSLNNGIKLNGIKFNNTKINNNYILSSFGYGIYLSDSFGNYSLSGNNAISNKTGGFYNDSNAYFLNSNSNIVYNCSGDGFYLTSIDECTFQNNIAVYNQGVGFYINDTNEDTPTGTIMGLSSLYNRGIGLYNFTPTIDLSIINAKLSFNTQSGLVGGFGNNSILSGIESKSNGVDGMYINTLSANNGLSGLQIYDSTITNNLSYGLRLSAVPANSYYGLTANNLLLSSNGINGLHVSFGDTCLLTNINSLCNNSNGIFIGTIKNSTLDLLSGNYNKVNGLSLTLSATDFILTDSTFSYNLSNGINLSGMDMLNSNIELHDCTLSANKVNGLNSTVLSANHLNINNSKISNNVIGYLLSSDYVDSLQIVSSTLNNNSIGFLLSGTSTNYLTPTDVVINNVTVENNTTNGIEIYNIIGNISSVRLYNNLSNGIITSLGNGIMVFDGISGYSTSTRNVINVVSARNYNQTIIKNSILSCVDGLNTANLLKINMEKLEEFRLENTILSSTNPLTFTTNRPKLEGSFMFHNCNSDKFNLSSIAVTQYQSDVFTETGMSVMKENNIEGNHYKWLPAGKISFDPTFGHDVNTFSEKLEPASSTLKLRSSSKLIPLLKSENIVVSVYVYKSSTYSGSSPRLILKNNPSIGVSETVLATSSGPNSTWELLTGVLPTITNDGVAELYIDCSGAVGSGSINIDSWNF